MVQAALVDLHLQNQEPLNGGGLFTFGSELCDTNPDPALVVLLKLADSKR